MEKLKFHGQPIGGFRKKGEKKKDDAGRDED